MFSTPPLTTRRGKSLWALLIPTYRAITFILAAGIPDFSDQAALVAAFCVLQSNYTFLLKLAISYCVKRAALTESEGFDPPLGL